MSIWTRIGCIITLLVFPFRFILANLSTMATDHQIPASKQQQPGSSAFKVRGTHVQPALQKKNKKKTQRLTKYF